MNEIVAISCFFLQKEILPGAWKYLLIAEV